MEDKNKLITLKKKPELAIFDELIEMSREIDEEYSQVM